MHAIHLCSNDYLGLSSNPALIRKAIASFRNISQCSSRLIAGNDPMFVQLEQKLAGHKKSESSIIYPTGYMANLGVISALADNKTVIFSDRLNHASIIDACRLGRSEVKIFEHNDYQQLAIMLESTSSDFRKILVTEGVFSMDGDISKLKEICKMARKHDAMVILDDAHGDFIFGANYSGVAEYLGVQKDVDIQISSLSKGLGCFGGYATVPEILREYLINKSRQFIFTSALPYHLCSAALHAIDIAKKGTRQKRLFNNIAYFIKGLNEIGFDTPKPSQSSQIIPILIGDEKMAVLFSQKLLSLGVFVQPIRYPTVQKGAARLRVSLTSMHSRDQLKFVIDSVRNVKKELM